MKQKLLLLLITAFLLVHFDGEAQSFVMRTPDASPKAIVGQMVGLTNVSITYHRPAVKKRTVWGELVPYNAIWRAGANDNTVISFSSDVSIEGKALRAGTYGLHMIPGENECTVIFSNNSTAWGSFSYKEEEDALRVKIRPEKSDKFYEYLTFTFDKLSEESATCALQWENKKFPFRIDTDVKQEVVSQLRRDLQSKPGFTWLGLHEAAKYCYDNDVNLDEALQWSSRSVFANPNPTNMALKAKLTGKVKGEGKPEKEREITLATLDSDLSASNSTWKEYVGAAKMATDMEAYDKALAWSDKAVSMSANMTSMMSKATVLEKQGNAKQAEKIRKEAVEKGTNAELNNYGYQLLFGGKKEEALKVFEANAQKNPTDPNVWDSLGEGYFTAGMRDKALVAFKKSLSLNPPDNVRANTMKYLTQMDINPEDLKP